MTATITPRIEIDDRIRQRPQLLAAVEQATDYLLSRTDGLDPPATVSWRLTDPGGESVEITLADTPDAGVPSARLPVRTRWLGDLPSQRMSVLEVWGKLLSNRSAVKMARINADLSRLEEEEQDGR